MIDKELFGYHVDEKIYFDELEAIYKVSKRTGSGKYVKTIKHITFPSREQYATVLISTAGDYEKTNSFFALESEKIVDVLKRLVTTNDIVQDYKIEVTETISSKTYNIYILMDHLTLLYEYLEENTFTIKDVIDLGRAILEELSFYHSNNIVHHQVRNDNIFITADGTFKLGNHDLTRELKDKIGIKASKEELNYIPPEVYFGKKQYESNCDLYSLGIVLYKLLNNARNPFLPSYPIMYYIGDEDAAFDMRMTGKTPELPLNAQNILGEIILKSIMVTEKRYSSASEFLGALDDVKQHLTEKELFMIVNSDKKAFITKKETDAKGSGNNHLSKTFENNSGIYQEEDNLRTMNTKPKKNYHWLIYSAPVFIAIIFVVVYLFILPHYCLIRIVALQEWLFDNPMLILEALKEPSVLLYPMYFITGIKILSWVLVASFITSLFFVGYTIQNKKPKANPNAKKIDKEAYMYANYLYEQVKLVTDTDASSAKKAIQSIYERLKNESGFGYGDDTVIDCENDIVLSLEEIEKHIQELYNKNTFDQATRSIEMECQKILSKLKIRIELKKK